jgi:formylglycine-generating enzyme required for sulfatase activity
VEWRAACGGSEGYAFPYGPDRVPGRCHDSGVNPMLAYHADTEARGWGPVELNDPRNIELDGTIAKTGAFANCVNDFGLYDMVGNLHEWTSDPNGTFQGGYWLDTSLHGDGCAYRTIAHPFDYRDYSIGFRCCSDPDGAPDAVRPTERTPPSGTR